MRELSPESFYQALTHEQTLAVHDYIEEEVRDSIADKMAGSRDDPDFFLEFSHFMTLGNSLPSKLMPDNLVFLAIDVRYVWGHKWKRGDGSDKRIEWSIEGAYVFLNENESNMRKWKEAVQTEAPLPIFN